MKHHLSTVTPGSLFILGKRQEAESHLSVLFPHWAGGNVIVTDVVESKFISAKISIQKNNSTITLVEFLFRDRIYSENIVDFLKRAKYASSPNYSLEEK